MTVPAVDLYGVPAVGLDLHVQLVKGLIWDCRHKLLAYPMDYSNFLLLAFKAGALFYYPTNQSIKRSQVKINRQNQSTTPRVASPRGIAAGVFKETARIPSPMCNSKCACKDDQLSSCDNSRNALLTAIGIALKLDSMVPR